MGRAEVDDRGRTKIVYSPSKRPLHLGDLDAHMDGTGPVVGIYLLRENDAYCKFASFDIDKQDLLAAEKLRNVAVELGFPDSAMMLVDSGSKGYHLHLFFEAWLPAAQARQLLRLVAARAGMHEKRNARDTEGIEFFPKQDGFSEHLSYGSLIKLPLVVHPASGRLAGIINARRVVPASPEAVTAVLGQAGGEEAQRHPEGSSEAVARPVGATEGMLGQAAPPPATHGGQSQAEIGTLTGNPSIVMEGGRNSFLASLAGKLRRDGLDEGSIANILLSTNQQACSPPLSEREVRTIAQSISRYPAGEGDLKLHPPLSTESTASPQGEIQVEGVERRGKAVIYKLGSYNSNIEASGTDWLIEQWLVRGTLTLTVGQEKLGKSTQAWHRVAAISNGSDYWGLKVRRGRCLVMTEMNPEVVQNLLDEDEIYPNWENVDVMLLDTYEPSQRIGALRDAVAGQDYSYLLLDPIDECMGLDADGVWNPATASAGFDALRDLMRTGLAVEGLYHFNNAGKVANSYKFRSKPDTVYELKGDGPAEITIRYRGRTRAIPKVRKIVGNGGDGYQITLLEAMPIGRPSKRQQVVASFMQGKGELTAHEVAEGVGVDLEAARQVLRRMVRAGTVEKPKEGSFIYRGVSYTQGQNRSQKRVYERGSTKEVVGVTYTTPEETSVPGGVRGVYEKSTYTPLDTTCPTCGSPAFPTESGGVFCFRCLQPAGT